MNDQTDRPSEFLVIAGFTTAPPPNLGASIVRVLEAVQTLCGDKGKVSLHMIRNLGDESPPVDVRWKSDRSGMLDVIDINARSISELISKGMLQSLPKDAGHVLVVGHDRSINEHYELTRWSIAYTPPEQKCVYVASEHGKSSKSGNFYPTLDAAFMVKANMSILGGEMLEMENAETETIEEYLDLVRGKYRGNRLALELPEAVADVLDAMGTCYYAAFDVGIDTELRGGTYYAGTSMGEVSWSREVNRRLWLLAGEDRRRWVRGIYWGQYLGPDLARRFDPDGSFAERYRGTRFRIDAYRPPFCKTYPGGGVFITLTPDPMDMAFDWRAHVVPDRNSAADAATMLHLQLRKTNLLL